MFDGPRAAHLGVSVAVGLGGAVTSVAAQPRAVFVPLVVPGRVFGGKPVAVEVCCPGRVVASALAAELVGVLGGLGRFGVLASGGGDVGVRFGGSELHRIVHLVVILHAQSVLRSVEGVESSHHFGGGGLCLALASAGIGCGCRR